MKSSNWLLAMAVALPVLAGFGATATTAEGSVVSYWRFEEGPAGAQIPHSTAGGVFDGTVPDASGNGNNLSVWAENWAGFKYSTLTPYATVPQTGQVNNFAIQNTGSYPAAFTNPAGTSVLSGIDARTIAPAAWSVEVSYKPENSNGWRTIVGRDARNIAPANNAYSAFYLQVSWDNRARVQFTDMAGIIHEAATAPNFITEGFTPGTDPTAMGRFYNFAATSDGTFLNLYVDGVLVASTDMTGTSSDTRLSNGSTGTASGSDWTAGVWTVGRGLYNGAHNDRAYGLIDEVRISDTALTPSQFLASQAIPEPASLTLTGLAALPLLRRRR